MSLIQDALKRKSEEAEVIRPPQPAVPEPGKNGPGLLAIILTVLIAAAITTALIVLTFYPINMGLFKKAAAKSSPVAPVVPEPAAVPNAPVQVIESSTVEIIAGPMKEEPAQDVKLGWPELKLTGIAQRDSQSFAILNGKMLSAGRKLGEVTVIEVQERNIVVEYLSEQRTLYIDE
jgi:hypothetical protein